MVRFGMVWRDVCRLSSLYALRQRAKLHRHAPHPLDQLRIPQDTNSDSAYATASNVEIATTLKSYESTRKRKESGCPKSSIRHQRRSIDKDREQPMKQSEDTYVSVDELDSVIKHKDAPLTVLTTESGTLRYQSFVQIPQILQADREMCCFFHLEGMRLLYLRPETFRQLHDQSMAHILTAYARIAVICKSMTSSSDKSYVKKARAMLLRDYHPDKLGTYASLYEVSPGVYKRPIDYVYTMLRAIDS